jgi:hypothetical protein
MRRTPAAEKRWAVFYNGLDDDVTGLVGAITARA